MFYHSRLFHHLDYLFKQWRIRNFRQTSSTIHWFFWVDGWTHQDQPALTFWQFWKSSGWQVDLKFNDRDKMNYLHQWRAWIRPLVVIIYFLLLAVALPMCIWELDKKDAQKHVIAWFVGGLFVMMALPISFWGILQHLVYYSQPYLQRHIIRLVHFSSVLNIKLINNIVLNLQNCIDKQISWCGLYTSHSS